MSNPANIIRLAEAIKFQHDYNRAVHADTFEPYDWQTDLFASDVECMQVMAMCANRVGKTAALTYRHFVHLTGLYPEWWPGAKYDRPIVAWALGVSGEQIRDVLQMHLFGRMINRHGKFFDGTGWIANELIENITLYPSVAKLAKDVWIKHKSGGASLLSFKSYSQGQHALMGNEIDEILIDEEPEDQEIYPQCLARIASGGREGKGGRVVLAMTPENGVTELVGQFMDDRKPGQCLINATWDDAKHLSEEAKTQILEALPPYQRDMRSKGVPLLGSGAVYPISEDRIICDPFEIPPHFKVLNGIDFGIDHPFACSWGAYDADTDTIYVYHEYAQAGEVPPIHVAAIKAAHRGGEIPTTYPHDGDNTEKGSGDDLVSNYEDDLNIIGKYSLPETGNKVEPGIADLYTRMKTGRFKVFSTCTLWLKEFRRYHRKDGKIVKLDDDLMDASRYMAGMIIEHGETVSCLGADDNAWSGASTENPYDRAAG